VKLGIVRNMNECKAQCTYTEECTAIHFVHMGSQANYCELLLIPETVGFTYGRTFDGGYSCYIIERIEPEPEPVPSEDDEEKSGDEQKSGDEEKPDGEDETKPDKSGEDERPPKPEESEDDDMEEFKDKVEFYKPDMTSDKRCYKGDYSRMNEEEMQSFEGLKFNECKAKCARRKHTEE